MNDTSTKPQHGPTPEALERLLSQGRDGALLRMGLALAYHRRGEFSAALGHVQKAQALDPQFSAAGRLHGLIALALGDTAGAEAAFDRALAVAHTRGEHQLARELEVRLRRLRPAAR